MTREELEQLIDRRNALTQERNVLAATATELEKEIYAIDGQIMAADTAP